MNIHFEVLTVHHTILLNYTSIEDSVEPKLFNPCQGIGTSQGFLLQYNNIDRYFSLSVSLFITAGTFGHAIYLYSDRIQYIQAMPHLY